MILTESTRKTWISMNIKNAFQLNLRRTPIIDDFFAQYAVQIDNFLSGKDSPKLIIYYQSESGDESDIQNSISEKRLILTTGDDVKLENKGIFFLRTTPPNKPINMEKIDNELLFGEITPEILEQLKYAMSLILENLVLKYKDGFEKCDEEQVSEFETSARRFEKELYISIQSLEKSMEECKLDKDEEARLINKGKDGQDKSKNSELKAFYLSNLKGWLAKFERVLTENQENMVTEAVAGQITMDGPEQELQWWRSRLQTLTLYSELIKPKGDYARVKDHLFNGGSGDEKELEKQCQQFENNLTEKLNEAKDNVKYLVTLEKFIKPLESGTPEEIIETLPALMNAIKMIHTIARYYKNNQKLTNLFMKITNAMINNCKERIKNCDLGKNSDPNKNSIWDKDPTKIIDVLEGCIKLSHKYKDEFNKTKNKSNDLPKANKWDFDTVAIFSKFEKFIKRVRKLIEIFGIIKQFQALKKHNNLEGIEELSKNFYTKLNDFTSKITEPLEVDSDFDRHYVELMQNIQKLDDELQQFIEKNFSKFRIISYSLKLLKKLKGILKSNTIKHRLEAKYETILQNYGSDIDSIMKRFDDNRSDPPILRNMPNEAGKIIWVRHLFERLNGPIQEFPENMIAHKEMRRYIDKFNLLGKSLVVYEIYFTRAWFSDIERAKSCLQTPLLTMKEENGQKKINVNFEKDIRKLIREAKALDREGIEEIPESAQIILLQEEKFKNYYYELDFIKNEYDRIIGLIKPVMKNILKPHIEDLDLKIRPGMVTLTWTSMNIDGYLHHVQLSLSKLEQLIININDIIDNRIENNLKKIGKVELVKLPQDAKPMTLDGFVEDQQTHIADKAIFLISKNIEIERAVDDLLETVTKYPLETDTNEGVDQKALQKIKGYYFWYMYQALLTSTQHSLIAMKNRICGKRTGPGDSASTLKPFFEVKLKLENKEVTLSPTLSKLEDAINRAATAILSCSKDLMRWTSYGTNRLEQGDMRDSSFYQIIAQDKEIVKVILLLTGSFKGTKDKVENFLKTFEDFSWLWLNDIQNDLEAFTKNNPSLQDYDEKLRWFNWYDKKIDNIPSLEEIGAMSFKTENLCDGLKQKCKEWKSQYSKDLHSKAKKELTEITEHIKNLYTKLQKDPEQGITSLGTVMSTLEEIKKEQATIDLKFGPILDMYGLLEMYLPNQVTEKEEMDNKTNLRQKWKELLVFAEKVQTTLQINQAKYLKTLKTDQAELGVLVEELRKDFEENGPKVAGITPKEASERLIKFEGIYIIREQLYKSNQLGENLFGLENREYPKLKETKKEIDYLSRLYSVYNRVNDVTSKWEDQIWIEIDVNQIRGWEEEIGIFNNECANMPKGLKEYQAFKDMKSKIENYRDVLPQIIELKDHTSFKDRHWEELIKVTGKKLNYQNPENFYIKDLVEADLKTYIDDLEEIINSGKKQKNIEKNKKEIVDRWTNYKFDFKKWAKSGVLILKGDTVLQIQEDLENDISTLSGLSANKHIGPFKDDVIQWQRTLSDIDKTLSDWIKVQVLWTNLEAVFTGGDIAKHLKNEAKKFKAINKSWKSNVMAKAVEQEKVKLCCQNDIIKSSLPVLQEDLLACQKELDKYLEQKRRSFPRFYFVSGPVLLKFLSQGSEPEHVQDEFDKIFDSIGKASFRNTKPGSVEKEIIAIHEVKGDDREDVAVTPVVCIGNIEDWLKKLEESMQLSIKGLLNLVYKHIKKADKLDIPTFVKSFAAQICLVGLQMRWTKQCQELLEDKSTRTKQSKDPVMNEIKEYQRALTELCKQDDSKLSKLDRTKLETLVLIAVYLEQVTTDKFQTKWNPNSFDWQKYTRVYWREDLDNLTICITDWTAIYSYEYLGVKERLCITPLTDRCYITLAQAMSMNYGGSPVGPAGTGKTETVKDLGRTLGIFVVVTNCGGEHRSADMAKIFKGLCQSGLWGCFDEFNRIFSEVLSVVAMQVESITLAKKQNSKEVSFPGESDKLPLIKTCGYFITMNPPSYGGRQKLPENLKVLFRSISMMVPNRDVIIQVKLASAGYYNYVELSKKFNVLYKLCEEQLSKQRHYDFGLRNILSVLRTAGKSLRDEELVLKAEAEKTGKDPKPANELFLMMRTLRDMNLSKLVFQDVSLFEALLKDIFPGEETPSEKYYPEIEPDIKNVIEEHALTNEKKWYRKIIQTYETSLVRHGFMIIGPVGSGKSSIINVLADSLSIKNKTSVIKLNPKSFTTQEMYGCNDFSGDWTPGVFSELWDKANKKENKIHTWITCDGPVDAVWIESLNTVLDDNKVLTLANGGRVFMRDTVKMVFEVENLNNASAATVSRCGQIYVSDLDLGYLPVMEAWVKQRTDDKKGTGGDETLLKNQITKLFHPNEAQVVLKILRKYFVENEVIEVVDKITHKNPIIRLFPILKMTATLNLLNGTFPISSGKNLRKFSEPEYNRMILYSIIWGVAGVYEPAERLQIQEWMKDKNYDLPKYHDGETIFDFTLNTSGDTVTWEKISVPKWEAPKRIEFSQILMPTLDSVRAEGLLRAIEKQEYSTISRRSSLVIGGPGTAKTSSVLMYANKFDTKEMVLHRINFSSATRPIHFQTSIESVCEMKIQRGFGPKDQKKMTVFIDDFSMPEYNKYGDQETLEIVRQLIEDSFFYNLDKVERGNPKYIENLRYVAAMNHPGGSKNEIPNRLKRQLFIFNMTLPERIDVIFDPILNAVFRPKDMGEDISEVVSHLSTATITLWKQFKKELLPTPAKFHYVFNLRDVSRIFKGMCTVAPDTIKNTNLLQKGEIKPELYMIALWKNECERVFVDKLVESREKLEKIKKWITDVAHENFRQWSGEMASKLDNKTMYFLNFAKPIELEEGDELSERPPRTYEALSDVDKVRYQSEKFLRAHNKKFPSKSMDLVLFDDALGHLLRISRIIEQKRSSALLVGVGGSGKQSLTRLAAFIGNQSVQQIVLVKGFNETMLKEFIKTLFAMAGYRGNQVTFLLTDAEIKFEEFLEYINMVLSTGEIPGLIPKDEKEIWLGELRNILGKLYKGKEFSDQQVYEFFVDRLRDNLHIVLCFSPIGNKFRERARKFPALFNECTIDWFLPWPKEALFNVAKQQIDNFDDLKTRKEIKDKELPDWMSSVHAQVDEACDSYYQQMRKTVYITPKSYLFFIKSYKNLYSREMKKILLAERNYQTGLAKIKEGKEKVEEQEVELNKKNEEIKIKQAKVKKVMDQISEKSSKAQARQKIVNIEADNISKDAAEIAIVKAACEEELKLALPALKRAEEAANKIDNEMISFWKGLLRAADPTPTAKYLVEAMSIILYQKVRNDVDFVKVKPTKSGQEYELMKDSWEICKNILQTTSLKSQLLARADKNNGGLINDEILELVEPYVNLLSGFLSAANIETTSKANIPLRDWVEQIVLFSVNARNVKPKQAALELQTEKLNQAETKLQASMAVLEEINKELAALNENLRVNKAEADELEADYREQMKKIKKANNLISSLSDERERWKDGLERLVKEKTDLVGNCGLATAFISYCGPFSAVFRDKIANDRFIKLLSQQKIPFKPDIYTKLVDFLVSDTIISQWNLEGLPKDTLSIQNGIMVESSERYPLLIDPQGQGAAWIKNKYKGESKDRTRQRVTIVTPIEEKKIKEALRYCVTEGEILILEGITGEVDPFFDPVLEKQYIKQGNKTMIMLGDEKEPIMPDFKLFITCKLANPKFTPELSAKVTIIDFTVTQGGLEQQLLSLVLSREMSVIEETLNSLLRKVTENKGVLQKLDEDLLNKLNSSEGNLLDDEGLLDILKNTKTQSKEISAQVAEAEVRTKEINEKRAAYNPVAVRGSVMYFCMIDISSINWMYNSSLNQFLNLYFSSIENSKDPENPTSGKKRVEEIESYLTYQVFEYVNRGLFSTHKVTFLLMVCFKILITAKELTEMDVGIFLKVGSSVEKNTKQKPNYKWLTDAIWQNIVDLSNHQFCGQSSAFFKTLPDSFNNHIDKWEPWFMYNDPEAHPIPEFEENIKNDKNGAFIKFCLIRALKPDRTIVASNTFIEKVLKDKRYVETPAEDVPVYFSKSRDREPVLYLLSEGADPTNSIQTYAQKIKKIVTSVSLGEGQGAKALAMIKEYMPLGNWIILQNCHLGIDFMEDMDNNLADPEFCKEMHPDFRIWMSCEPTDSFPLGLLQKSLKVTNEPPKGIKAGMRKTFKTIITNDFFEKIEHGAWRSLCYVLSFLHSLMQERRKFGPIGWCIPYEFNDSDLEASLAYIEKYLNQLMSAQGQGAIPQNININFDVINYMVMQIQYGGKVSDDVDRDILNAYGEKYFKNNIVSSTASDFNLAVLSDGRKYKLPTGQEYKSYDDEINNIEALDSSEVFGMSVFADIACRLKETKEMLETLTETRPKEGALAAGGLTKDEIIQQQSRKRLQALTFSYPGSVIEDHVKKLRGPKGYPSDQTGYSVPLNVFLSQELQRMDRIILIIKKTFSDIIDAVDGQILMTTTIVDAIDCLYNNKVPQSWLFDPSGAQISWMKFKYSVWFDSLKVRNHTLEEWMKGTRPKAFNLDHFFNPSGLLTSMKQEVVRISKAKSGMKHTAKDKQVVEMSMDKVEYDVIVMPTEKAKNFYESKQEVQNDGGIFLVGLSIEGATYKEGLTEAKEKTLIYPMPPIEIYAKPSDASSGGQGDKKSSSDNKYQCPLYKYPMRTDDYLITKIPLGNATSGKDNNPLSWTLKGVALLSYCDI